MKAFADLGVFAAFLAAKAATLPEAEKRGLEESAKLIETEAKALIGQERPEWPPLAPSTIADKERHGYTGRVSATDPLLREGQMRESIEHTVGEREAAIGSNDRVAIYQELGTSRGIPPRSFLGLAAHRKAEQVVEVVGETVTRALGGEL